MINCEQFYQRKEFFMPRPARKDYPSQFFHVIVQGINQEFIFLSYSFIHYYFQSVIHSLNSLSSDPTITFSPRLLAYCIMNNHAHFLFASSDISCLSKIMHSANTDYAKYYNQKLKRVGYVFRNRFKSEPIRNEFHLLHCLAYIHQNPVKANLVNRCEDYPYSSYNDYVTGLGIATKENRKLLFGTENNYLATFYSLHQTSSVYMDIDLQPKEILDIRLTEFLAQFPNYTFSEIKYNQCIFLQFFTFLTSSSHYISISYQDLADYFGISYHKIHYWKRKEKRDKNCS